MINNFEDYLKTIDFEQLTDSQRSEFELLETYKMVFECGQIGNNVLKDLQDRFYFYNTTKGDTPEETAMREGMRFVVLYILDNIEKAKLKDKLNIN